MLEDSKEAGTIQQIEKILTEETVQPRQTCLHYM